MFDPQRRHRVDFFSFCFEHRLLSFLLSFLLTGLAMTSKCRRIVLTETSCEHDTDHFRRDCC